MSELWTSHQGTFTHRTLGSTVIAIPQTLRWLEETDAAKMELESVENQELGQLEKNQFLQVSMADLPIRARNPRRHIQSYRHS